jgi:hypothetical protein
MNIFKVPAILSIAFSLLAWGPPVAAAEVVDATVDSINIKPKSNAGDIDIVHLQLPVLDAFKSLQLTVDRTATSKKITIRNTGTGVLYVWYDPVRKGHNTRDVVFLNGAGLATLKPGETTKTTASYQNGQQGPYGEYMVVMAAAPRSKYDLEDGTATDAGRQVNRYLQRFEEKVRALDAELEHK